MLGHALPPDDHSIVVPTSALPFRTSVTFRREGRYSIGQSASVPRSFGQRFPSALFHRAVLTSKTTPAPYRAALQQPGCATVSPGAWAWGVLQASGYSAVSARVSCLRFGLPLVGTVQLDETLSRRFENVGRSRWPPVQARSPIVGRTAGRNPCRAARAATAEEGGIRGRSL